MDNKKDIGRMFKEQLTDFSKSPENIIWKDIEAALDKEKDSKASYWVPLTGVFVLISMFIIIGVTTFNDTPNTTTHPYTNSYEHQDDDCDVTVTCIDAPVDHNTNHNSIDIITKVKTTIDKTETDQPRIQEKDQISNTVTSTVVNTPKSTEFSNNVIAHQKNKNEIIKKSKITIPTKNPQDTSDNVSNAIAFKKDTAILSESEISVDTINSKNSKNNMVSDHYEETKNAVQEKLLKEKPVANNTTDKDTLIYMQPIPQKDVQKFSLTLHVIPTYTFSSNGSLISDQLANNSTNGKFTINYGAVFASHLTQKIGLRIGYNRIKLQNRTIDIKSDILANALLDSGTFLSNIMTQSVTNQESVQLTQRLDYHEISAELSYTLIDKKIKMALVGGASFLVLQKNNLTLHSGADEFRLGTNNNIKPTNTSLNFGTSFKYPLFDNLNFTIEPLIKYQLQKASKNSEGSTPFYFTIQSGISIDF
ncbi:hypothetical protein [Aquimarina sp. 2201CG14-23]|uniref:hypothetical protein n=1 Tax=Aquimarina mycalae TaxID=3040073 RepID=UPI002477E453|nr:hypothetical protein [Aquimarina sp. 2201CG14-23]MDH7445126.1 hypothetical protein [Aquimarina sp. 2201CG14-23]